MLQSNKKILLNLRSQLKWKLKRRKCKLNNQKNFKNPQMAIMHQPI
jgi:hypothetical protein